MFCSGQSRIILIVVILCTVIYIYEKETLNVESYIQILKSGEQIKSNDTEIHGSQLLYTTARNNTPETDKWKDLLQCQKMRLSHLKEECSKLDLPTNLQSYSKDDLKAIAYKFLLNDKQNVILKAIPKSGCSSWKTMFILNYLNKDSVTQLSVHDWPKITSVYGLKVLHQLSQKEILYYLEKSYSILTVRHPLARLESGFRDKILKKTGRVDVEDKRVVAATFQQFLDDILKETDDYRLNTHWKPVTIHTNPCAIPFDFIAKTETASRDMQYILEEKLSSSHNAVHKHRYRQTESFTSHEREIDGGKELPLFSLLEKPEETIKKLMSKYKLDMKLFGYSYKNEQGNIIALCDNYKKYKVCC